MIAKRNSGQNTTRFRLSNDIAGIRRLLGQAALFPPNDGNVFSSAKNRTATNKL
jgi:hypothetical protein